MDGAIRHLNNRVKESKFALRNPRTDFVLNPFWGHCCDKSSTDCQSHPFLNCELLWCGSCDLQMSHSLFDSLPYV